MEGKRDPAAKLGLLRSFDRRKACLILNIRTENGLSGFPDLL